MLTGASVRAQGSKVGLQSAEACDSNDEEALEVSGAATAVVLPSKEGEEGALLAASRIGERKP